MLTLQSTVLVESRFLELEVGSTTTHFYFFCCLGIPSLSLPTSPQDESHSRRSVLALSAILFSASRPNYTATN